MSFDGANNLIRGLREVKRLSRAKFSISSLKCHFWEKSQKGWQGWIFEFLRIQPIWFLSFFTNKPLSEWPFSVKLRKSYIGWIRKNPGIQTSYHYIEFPSKMANLGWKLNFRNFSVFSLAAVIWLTNIMESVSNIKNFINIFMSPTLEWQFLSQSGLSYMNKSHYIKIKKSVEVPILMDWKDCHSFIVTKTTRLSVI